MNKYNYLHILWQDDIKFYPNLLNMINTEKDFFNSKEHLFITPHKMVYEHLKIYNNILLVDEKNMLNKYGACANWIFIHAMNAKKLDIIKIRKKISRKIIWRTWGHDIRKVKYKEYEFIKNKMRKVLNFLYLRKIRQFYAIGVANDVDIVNINNVFGNNIKTLKLSYTYRVGAYDNLVEIKNKSLQKGNKSTRIMVGHCGAEADRHLEIFEKLKKYKDENIIISLILSYGNKDYIKKVKSKAVEIFNDKVEFINNYMEYDDFAKYISTVDVAILDQIYSNALGNLSLLIFFQKKVYINRNGNIAESFCNSGIKANYTDDIYKLSFEEFVINEEFDKKLLKYSSIHSHICDCENWRNILESLNNDLLNA